MLPGGRLPGDPNCDVAAAASLAVGGAHSARVVYDDGLKMRQDAYKAGLPFIGDAELSRRVITLAKQTPERAWLGEVSAVILQQSLADLGRAYRNWFADLKRVKAARAKGENAKLKVRQPRYKCRQHQQAIRFTANARFRLLPNGRLRLPKIGDVKVRWSRELPSEPSSVTLSLDGAGRYHASFVVEIAEAPLPSADTAVGVDLGLSSFAALSTGEKSTVRAGCGSGRRRCGVPSETWRASGGGRGTGRGPVARSPACTLGWPMPVGTSTTSSPPVWSAKTGRCAWKPSTSREWAAPSWPGVSTTPAGVSSRPCWSTKPGCPGGRWSRLARGTRRASSARRVAAATAPSP
jgi:hypothetical protein